MTIGLSFPFHGLLVLQLGLHKTNDLQQRCLLRCFNFNESIPNSTKIQNKTKLLDGHIISDFSDYYEFMSKDPKQNLNLKISQGFKNLPFEP